MSKKGQVLLFSSSKVKSMVGSVLFSLPVIFIQYSKSFIQLEKIKALKIHKCECSLEIPNNLSIDNTLHR